MDFGGLNVKCFPNVVALISSVQYVNEDDRLNKMESGKEIFLISIGRYISKRCLHKILYVYMSLCLSRHQMSGLKVSFTKLIDA